MRHLALTLPLLALSPAAGAADPAVDLDGLGLGPKIVGPVGPEVNVSLTDGPDTLGDLESSVACPGDYSACAPSTDPGGTIYTYIHRVTPGADTDNDAPFPAPGPALAFDGVREFRLNFSAAGFTGLAGYSFKDAAAALGGGGAFGVERRDDGSLVWTVSGGDGWDSGETVTFFWQTTQPPSGPKGQYALSNGKRTAIGNGPLPAPVTVAGPPTLARLD